MMQKIQRAFLKLITRKHSRQWKIPIPDCRHRIEFVRNICHRHANNRKVDRMNEVRGKNKSNKQFLINKWLWITYIGIAVQILRRKYKTSSLFTVASHWTRLDSNAISSLFACTIDLKLPLYTHTCCLWYI